jgi:5,10-methylenetetrahydromethanopterin reductase
VKFDVGILNNQPVADVARQAQLAESLGFDTVWITDSHLVCRELWTTLAACALATSKIKLGPGVTVPHTRHWSVTASAIATLEEMAPGRIVLGIGTGGSSAETMGMSVQRAARVATLDTMVTSIRRLVAGGSAPLEGGGPSRLAWLPGPRKVPIYVAGSGPRMLEAAGRLGDGAIMYAGVDPAILQAGLQCIERGAVGRGGRLGDLEIVLWTPTAVDRNRTLARDHVRGRVASAMRHPLPVALAPEDEAAVDRIRAAYDSYQHATAASASTRAGARSLRGHDGAGRRARGSSRAGAPRDDRAGDRRGSSSCRKTPVRGSSSGKSNPPDVRRGGHGTSPREQPGVEVVAAREECVRSDCRQLAGDRARRPGCRDRGSPPACRAAVHVGDGVAHVDHVPRGHAPALDDSARWRRP